MPERRINLDTRARVVALEARYRRVVTKLTAAVAVISLTLIAVSVVLAVLVGRSIDLSHRLATINREQQATRVTNTREICNTINGNVIAISATSRFLGRLIVDGAVQSKGADEALFRKAGQPPYKERLRRAKQIAAGLRKRERALIDCEALARRIAADAAAGPG